MSGTRETKRVNGPVTGGSGGEGRREVGQKLQVEFIFEKVFRKN